MKRVEELELRTEPQEDGTFVAVVALDPDFAGFAGHFPGAPVLPGMCHVELAVRAASLAIGAPVELVAVERARFQRKALPGEELRIALTLGTAEHVLRRVDARHSVAGVAVAELHLHLAMRS